MADPAVVPDDPYHVTDPVTGERSLYVTIRHGSDYVPPEPDAGAVVSPLGDASSPTYTMEPDAAPAAEEKSYEMEPDEQTVGGAVRAGTSGINSGALTGLPGLPVDTTRAAEELVKAGLGTAVGEVTSSDVTLPEKTPGGLYHYVDPTTGAETFSKRKPPEGAKPVVEHRGGDIPSWLQPASEEEKARDIGSSGWLKTQIRHLGGSSLIDSDERTQLNNYLHAAGEGVAPALVGGEMNAVAPVARAAVAGAAANTAAEAAGQFTDDPALRTAASLLAGHAAGRARLPATRSGVKPAATPEYSGPEEFLPENLHKAPPPASEAAPAAPGARATLPPAPLPVQQTGHAVRNGTHEVTSPGGGKITAVADAERGVLQVRSAAVPQTERGKGAATSMLERLAHEAGQRGLKLVSDTQVSAPEQGVYANLARRGWNVKENPNTVDPGTGVKTSKSELKPVYEVSPPLDLNAKKPFSIMSAERATPAENAAATAKLRNQLRASGIPFHETQGSYKGATETSFAVETRTPGARKQVEALAKQYGQESVLHIDKDKTASLRFMDGSPDVPLGRFAPVTPEHAQGLDAWTRDSRGNFYATHPTEEQAKAPEATPAAAPGRAISFKPPIEEGVVTGDAPAAEQAQRKTTLRQLQPFGLKEVRTTALTGNSKSAGTDYQTGKLDGKPGERMTRGINNERASLVNYARDIIDRTGGTAGLDQVDRAARGRTMAAPVESYEDFLESETRRMYDAADEAAGGKPIELLGTQKFMNENRADFLGTIEGKQLLEGVQAQMKTLGLTGPNETFNPSTVEQAERMRQYLNDQWTPRTSRLIAKLKGELDMDVAKAGGQGLYEDARNLRALRDKIIEQPAGVQALRKPDDKLGINRPVAIEDVPAHTVRLPLEQFNHLIDVYKMAAKASPKLAAQAHAAINEIRAQMANEVLRAGDGAVPGGAWNVKEVNKYLNDNVARMSRVFSPAELERFKTLNDAGAYLRMDRSYPGAAAQGHNLAVRGALGLVEHGATGAGALLGHIPGALVGAGLSKGAQMADKAMLARGVEGRFTKLEPPPGFKSPASGQPGAGVGPKNQRGNFSTKLIPKSEPMMRFRHFSNQPNLKTLDPNKQGTGTAATNAERNRSTKVSALYPDKMNREQPEALVRQNAPHQYTASVPKSKMYDAVNDPDNLRGTKSFDAYEAAIKRKGYTGYYINNPDEPLFHGQARMFKPVPVEPVGASRGMKDQPLGTPGPGRYQRGAIAFHGTSHNFEPEAGEPLGRFRSDKIGTGEGAAAFGHGLYFAENPTVANTYRHAGSGGIDPDTTTYKGQKIETLYNRATAAQDRANRGNDKEAINQANAEAYFWESLMTRTHPDTAITNAKADPSWPNLHKFASGLDRAGFNVPKVGNVYKIDIPDRHVARMLDGDAKLSEQTPYVKAALKKLGVDPDGEEGKLTGHELYDQLQKKHWGTPKQMTRFAEIAQKMRDTGKRSLTGSELTEMQKLSSLYMGEGIPRGGVPKVTSDRLMRAGIPGIKYLDQHSRTPPEELSAALEKVKGEALDYKFAGHTDAEMHAKFAARVAAAQSAIDKHPKTRNLVVFDPNITKIIGKE